MLLAALGIFLLCALLIDNFLAAEHARAGPGDFHRGHRRLHHVVLPGVGHFDLSVGSVIACAGVVAAIVMRDTDSVLLGIGAALLMGLIVGLINGIVIAKLRVNALITTLATMQIVRGLAYIFADGKAVGVSQEQFFIFGNGQLLGVPVPILITIVCFVFSAGCSTTPPTDATPWPSAATRKRRCSPG
jgi:L-arabinose transport system permease protein